MSVRWLPARPCVLAHSSRTTTTTLLLQPSPSASLRAAADGHGSIVRPRLAAGPGRQQQRRTLLTLAIESSCDDSCVAVLHKSPATGAARLLFNKKLTSDNREFGGVHPLTAALSHASVLGPLVQEALRALPPPPAEQQQGGGGGEPRGKDVVWVDGAPRAKPDFVAVTRGPGMTSNLGTGLSTAKGIAAAWDVPLLGVNHMQAHALTPRLVSALELGKREDQGRRNGEDDQARSGSTNPTTTTPGERDAGDEGSKSSSSSSSFSPAFPFYSLLVSGGHTMLVRSRGLNDHEILAQAANIAIGDMLDKCARVVLPPEQSEASALKEGDMFGPLLERFAFPDGGGTDADAYGYHPPRRRADEIKMLDSGFGWTLTPPLSTTRAMAYDFSGFGSQVQRVAETRPGMPVEERRALARDTMRLAFEHLASRLLFALEPTPQGGTLGGGGGNRNANKDDNNLYKTNGIPTTVVVSGGVASNRYLMHILRSMLDARGFGDVEVVAPPPALCTDNAAMVAWTAVEMYEAGYRSDMDILAIRKWPIDPRAEGGGILGASGWVNVNEQDKK